MSSLKTPLASIPTIKKYHLSRLKKLGIETVEDLLMHFPARYDDFSANVHIKEISPNTRVTIEATVKEFSSKRSWRKKLLISKALFEDESGSMEALWFGQKFLEKLIVPGRRVRCSGKAILKDGAVLLQGPECESITRSKTHTGGLVAVYPETEGLTSKWLRWQIQAILPKIRPLHEILPKDIRSRLHLPSRSQAFRYIHTPATQDHALLARKYFAFEEMFVLQLFFLQSKIQNTNTSAMQYPENSSDTENFIHTLPFPLTQDQIQAVNHIIQDLANPHPMNRLLNGDVGSGKTVVATIASRHIATQGQQVAMLAPTEVLALQHFESFRNLLKKTHLSIGLFTRNYHLLHYPHASDAEVLRKSQYLEAIKQGLVDIVIGTHALLEDNVSFKALALVIIDEQHRFGVRQRSLLQSKAHTLDDGLTQYTPHLLSMTATPIPRSLAIVLFGNLDVSLLETMPKNRIPIITRIIDPEHREQAYAFIRSEIHKGRQAYIILPFVEESEAFENVKSAVTEHARLQKNIFPNLALGLLHGRMKAQEKEAVMREFKDGTIHILVATSVVEVGVDVPNATVMIIENADRFGLSQLHQFRGRIGRGTHQSHCFLFRSDDAITSSKRMRILETTTSGFKIAEADMKLRGSGQFLGTRQSGLPDIAMESMGNIRLITLAREEAQKLLTDDPSLNTHPSLQSVMKTFGQDMHFE